MNGGDKRTLAERAKEAFARTVNPPPDIGIEDVEPEALSRLEAAVRSLRRLDREILLARRLDAMSYEEIAKRTRLSIHQVERSMHRALLGVSRHLHGERRRRFRWPF